MANRAGAALEVSGEEGGYSRVLGHSVEKRKFKDGSLFVAWAVGEGSVLGEQKFPAWARAMSSWDSGVNLTLWHSRSEAKIPRSQFVKDLQSLGI